MSTFCLDLYGLNLWKYDGHEVEQLYMLHGVRLYVAYGKSMPLLIVLYCQLLITLYLLILHWRYGVRSMIVPRGDCVLGHPPI